MRVLIITDTFPPEKVGSYRMHDLAVNFSRDGFEVTVICPPPTYPFGSFKRSWKPVEVHFSNGIRTINLWTWQPASIVVGMLSRFAYYVIMPIIAIAWIMLNCDFDVIITSSGTTPFIWLPGLVQKKILKKPWIIDERDLLIDGAISLGFLNKDSLLTTLLRKLDAKCYQLSDSIIVPTESVRRGLFSYNVKKDKVSLIPNAAETNIFYPRPTAKKRQIIYAGSIGRAYDFTCVISAMKEISTHNIRLIIVGEGEVKHSLQKLVSTNSLNNHIKFLGGMERSKLPQLLSESIAGLAPVKKLEIIEGALPAKIFDYMACAIPFVAFGGSDLKDIAERSGSGFVIENNPDLLARTIIDLADNPALASEMGAKGLEYCKKFYNRKLMAEYVKLILFRCYSHNRLLFKRKTKAFTKKENSSARHKHYS